MGFQKSHHENSSLIVNKPLTYPAKTPHSFQQGTIPKQLRSHHFYTLQFNNTAKMMETAAAATKAIHGLVQKTLPLKAKWQRIPSTPLPRSSHTLSVIAGKKPLSSYHALGFFIQILLKHDAILLEVSLKIKSNPQSSRPRLHLRRRDLPPRTS